MAEKNIDYRLDLDNEVTKFAQNVSEDDFCIYLRHNTKDGEGFFYTQTGADGYVPALTPLGGNPSDYMRFTNLAEVILTLAAGLLNEDPELKEEFYRHIESNACEK